VLQCVAVCCSALQCVVVCCSALQCVAVCCSALQGVAGCCSVLQCVAVCYSVMQCVAVFFSMTPQYYQKLRVLQENKFSRFSEHTSNKNRIFKNRVLHLECQLSNLKTQSIVQNSFDNLVLYVAFATFR